MKFTLAVSALMVMIIGSLLVFGDQAVPQILYRIAFFVGLSTFASFLLTSGSFEVRFQSDKFVWAFRLFTLFLGLSPFLLLVASGWAGYRGFSSWLRGASACIAFVGMAGVFASLLVPRFIRRRAQ